MRKESLADREEKTEMVSMFFSMFFEEKENRDSKAVPVAYEIVTG